jgi:regulator of sigma E protease
VAHVSWFLAFAGFAALIILHEFGHFAAAKAVGMRVERFALFFPPLLFKVKRGETEYGIGAVPLGGYVRITGMNPNEEIPPEHQHRAYYRQPVWKRIVVIAAGPAMNILVAFLILFFLYVGFGTAKATKNVDQIEKGKPAAAVLQSGDRIVAVDGVRGDQATISKQIGTHTCAGTPKNGCRATTPAEITFVRDGRQRTAKVTPVYDAARGRTRLGFSYGVVKEDAGVSRSTSLSLDSMWRITKVSVSIPARLLDAQKRKELSGPVGNYETTRQAFKFDTAQALYVLAIISMSLAIVNLFPFLPLDGGHIFWALAEKVRGRAIPFAWMERASVVGFMLVMVLFFIGLTNDIGRLQGDGFQIR